ncbi:ATP-binding cassette domain-containing protein [Parabacteroides pacaensis]|uniref:ATP-binding cassette domain-containing protein n=1 Tax=Parabacteroides pacaensis TaxID=2086575 RepID=UPI000D10F42F|nr:ATP-binding cassette domain-containing protein [Parabacteroides pacaensis]
MDEKKIVIAINNVVPRLPELRFKFPLNWTIREGEQWAVIGPNGSGKTLIADILQNKYAIKEGAITLGYDGKIRDLVKCIAFKDIYSLADCRNSYYQQRWHATETDEVPTVEELLKEYRGSTSFEKVLDVFNVKEFLPKKIIFLSSGELRKFLIIRTLLASPKILILDNPFIGLDAPSRKLLVEMLEHISGLQGVQVILLLSNPEDIPEMITHVLAVRNKICSEPCSREEFISDKEKIEQLFFLPDKKIFLPVKENKPSMHKVTLRMEHVFIKYGSRIILKDLDWEVKNGEKWALFGPNGAGKSTLLSLIYADNPQSYANTLYLFDRKRGTGESIWEIKKRIGYVSPEMHLYYMENVPTIHIVGSGFFDSIGLYRKCNAEQERVALEWMKLFGIEELKERSFLSLSSGEQRLALLARAFVKDPDLIILDEPLHGLDVVNKQLAANIIETFCSRPGKTLIYVTHYPHELPSCVNKQFTLQKHV